MPRNALLNNVEHKDLRVITRRAAALGDAVMSALTFPAEFRNVQAHYPIVFQKASDGRFQPVALFGFQEGENLFLDAEGNWENAYVPHSVARQPFLIGTAGEELRMVIDLEHPRVSRTEGEFLFLQHGGMTEYLTRMASVLRTLHDGIDSIAPFCAALLEHELLESFVLDVQLADGSQNRLAGFYTIHEEKLGKLAPDALGRLHAAGHLQPIYMQLASLGQLRALMLRRSKKNAHA